MKSIFAPSMAALSCLGLASASPCPQSKGFKLRVDVTGDQDLNPSVQGMYLTGQRVGAGTNLATVSPSGGGIFYVNGTDAATATIVTDVVNVYPLSLRVQGPDEFDFSYPEEHNMGIDLSGGTEGLGVTPNQQLTGPAAGGYLVCRRNFTFPSGPTELLLPRYRYEGEEVPEGCAEVAFRPECAALPELPEDARWNHDAAQRVECLRQ